MMGAQEIIDLVRQQARDMARYANTQAEGFRRDELRDWRLIKTLKDSNYPRPAPRNRYIIVDNIPESPYTESRFGDLIDFPEVEPPPVGFSISNLPNYNTWLIDGRVATVYAATFSYSKRPALGEVIEYQGQTYKAVGINRPWGGIGIAFERVG